MSTDHQQNNENPLQHLDEWDDDVRARYPKPDRSSDAFRDYSADTRPGVEEFYRLNHTRQTVEFVRAARAKYLPRKRRQMGIWEAMEFLGELLDDSDPDIELPQLAHAIQTAEAIRAAGQPRWFVLTGLIHDMGKVLCLFDEPQWAVTGDTFPVGCRYSEGIVYHHFFADNPDSQNPEFQSKFGIYEPGCGLKNVLMSWGHDEYLYHVVRDYVPLEAQYMIRYHSFYPCHRERDYEYLMDDQDKEMFRWVRKFNPFDLYTKSSTAPEVEKVMPFYRELVAEFFPERIWW